MFKKTDLYMVVQIPLNTGSYFFIFQFEHALKSPLAFKKSETITRSVLVDSCDLKYLCFVITAMIILRG